MKARRITTQPDQGKAAQCVLGGWLNGTKSYLRIGDRDDTMLGTVSGGKLYRLAKAIVVHYEDAMVSEAKGKR